MVQCKQVSLCESFAVTFRSLTAETTNKIEHFLWIALLVGSSALGTWIVSLFFLSKLADRILDTQHSRYTTVN